MRRAIIALFLLLSLPLQAASPVPEYDMKAAFLYNFAQFTEWPETFSQKFNLCILGVDPFGQALETIEGKQIRGAKLNVMHIASANSASACHMLYFGENERTNIQKILSQLEGMPILTISDSDDLAKFGVMISLRIQDKRLTFEVNNEAARRARLILSSKMLWLARKVY